MLLYKKHMYLDLVHNNTLIRLENQDILYKYL